MATTTSKTIAVLAVAVAIISAACYQTWKQTDASWRLKWVGRDAADLQASLATAKQNAYQEHDWQQKFAALDADFQEKVRRVNYEANSAIDAYRRGNLRLRASLNCAARNMPDAATPSGVRDAAAGCGLSAGDVEFLIRYAEKANVTAKQLSAAQALLKIIYARHPELIQ